MPEARTNPARILDGDQVQVATFQHVDLIDGVGVVVASALDFFEKHLRALEPGLHNDLWTVLDQIAILRNVDGPILKEADEAR